MSGFVDMRAPGKQRQFAVVVPPQRLAPGHEPGLIKRWERAPVPALVLRAISATEAAGYRARPRKAGMPSRKLNQSPCTGRACAVDRGAVIAARGHDWRFGARSG